ncbi:hypothetical protein Moror_9241 [Moniliophthora roreri MCA 2997]|uniref:Uncharacterized protein n=1 Tax=Moniliophthora roreri (strain MCA 2997) TaxID=1381753 RepID=V2WXI4_MONRO|nr:hypothetical protein Moror_9241 [Moniliophthora roreri MCA 2997]
MASSSTPPPDTSYTISVKAIATHYELKPPSATSKKKNAAPSYVKRDKTKELTFEFNKNKSIDINNQDEYKVLVLKIIEKQSIKPVHVWFNTRDVEQVLVGTSFLLHAMFPTFWCRRSALYKMGMTVRVLKDEKSDRSELNKQNDDAANSKSTMELGVHQFWNMLKDKYSTEGTQARWYMCPQTGKQVALTPSSSNHLFFSQHDGKATLMEPLHLWTFDPSMHKAALNPCSHRDSEVTTAFKRSASAGTEEALSLGHLASIVNTIFGAHNINANANAKVSTMLDTSGSSPPSASINSPMKLLPFLAFASRSLSIDVPVLTEVQMKADRIGPDIMHHMSNDNLVCYGFLKGDAIRIRENSLK